MKRNIEKAAILLVSTIMLSSYAVSITIPDMVSYYSDYSRSSVERLISMVSLMVSIMIVLNSVLSKFLSERQSITIGMILVTIFGGIPVFNQTYPVVFAGRIMLGVGLGLINLHAINMINARYEGRERASMLGLRNSAEALGNTVLTLIAGQLLRFGWNRAYMIYLVALPILLCYLLFVPSKENNEKIVDQNASYTENSFKKYIPIAVFSAIQGAFFVCINTCNNLRIPTIFVERGIGTSVQSSFVLSSMNIMGIILGFFFGWLSYKLKKKLQGTMLLLQGFSMFLMAIAPNIFVFFVAALLLGIANNALVTTVFLYVADSFPKEHVKMGTTFALVGCNLGATLSSFVLQGIGLFTNSINGHLYVIAIISFIVGFISLLKTRKNV